MSTLHEDVTQEIRRQVEAVNDAKAPDLSPKMIAGLVFTVFAKGTEEPHVQYACIEHFTQLSRRVLAREFGAENDPGLATQADMFSGHLQERYPIRTPVGEEPIYRVREALTDADLEWNIQRLRKISDAARTHADALAAYQLKQRMLKAAA